MLRSDCRSTERRLLGRRCSTRTLELIRLRAHALPCAPIRAWDNAQRSQRTSAPAALPRSAALRLAQEYGVQRAVPHEPCGCAPSDRGSSARILPLSSELGMPIHGSLDQPWNLRSGSIRHRCDRNQNLRSDRRQLEQSSSGCEARNCEGMKMQWYLPCLYLRHRNFRKSTSKLRLFRFLVCRPHNAHPPEHAADPPHTAQTRPPAATQAAHQSSHSDRTRPDADSCHQQPNAEPDPEQQQ